MIKFIAERNGRPMLRLGLSRENCPESCRLRINITRRIDNSWQDVVDIARGEVGIETALRT